MVNPNYPAINAEQQENDPDSVLNYYRALIRMRKEHPVMVYGEFQEYEPEREDVYLYTRSLDGERWLIALNLTGQWRQSARRKGSIRSFWPTTPTRTCRARACICAPGRQ